MISFFDAQINLCLPELSDLIRSKQRISYREIPTIYNKKDFLKNQIKHLIKIQTTFSILRYSVISNSTILLYSGTT